MYLFRGCRDGTRFLSRAGETGGKTGIPIESIRLKLILEDLEGYEHLLMING